MEPRDWPRAHAWGRLVRDQRCWHGSTAPAGACERDGVSHSHDLSWWARKLLEPARPDTTPLSFEGPRTIVFVLHPARSLSIHHMASVVQPARRIAVNSRRPPQWRRSREPRSSRMPTACLAKPGVARADFLGSTWNSPIGASIFNLQPRGRPGGAPVGHKVGHTDTHRGLEL